MKKIFIVIFLVIISVGSAVTYKIVTTEPTETEKLKITTSFYPLAEFARQVGGENVEVINITSPGSEQHDYEPTQQDIIHVNSSEIFNVNGYVFDTWADAIDA